MSLNGGSSSRRALVLFAALVALLGTLTLPAAAVESDTVFAFGDAANLGGTGIDDVGGVVDVERTPTGNGYWVVSGRGKVVTKGDASFFGDASNVLLNGRVVDFFATPSGAGYVLIMSDGGVLTFGNAMFFGSTGSLVLNAPIARGHYTPAGNGYWLMGGDAGVFSFGAAGFYGTVAPATRGTARAIGFAPSSTGNGYTIVLDDGRTFEFGDASALPNFASGGLVDASLTPARTGAFGVTKAGVVSTAGSVTKPNPGDQSSTRDIVAIESTSSGSGYWVATTGPQPGIIQGTVTTVGGGTLTGICVTATTTTGAWQHLSAKTDASGNYTLRPSRNASFIVHFSDCATGRHLPEYYDDAMRREDADVITTTSDGVATANAALTRGGTVAGVVSNEAGTPLPGVCVAAVGGIDEFGNNARRYETTTTSTGFYRVLGLPEGDFDIRYDDCNTGQYLGEWHDDQDFQALATSVDVATSQDVTGVNAKLSAAGRVTGVLTGPSGEPVTYSCVELRSDDSTAGYAYTSSTGYYAIGRLRSGSYKMLLNGCLDHRFAREWYPNASSEAGAAPVSVQEGADTVVSAVLEAPSRINGVITRQSDGSPVSGMGCVTVYNGEEHVGEAWTSHTGFYSVGGLRSGSYQVRFRSCTPFADLAGEWWDNSPTRAGATSVSVPNANIAHNINAALSPGGSFSGVVTGPGNVPLNFLCVQAYDELGVGVGYTYTSNTGYYQLRGLSSGGHKVQFGCGFSGFAEEWWSDKTNQADATAVSVTAGTNTPNINATLETAGAVTGVVRDSTGAPIDRACVTTSPARTYGTSFTSATGFYKIDRLRPGSYKVVFEDCMGLGYNDQWWNASDEAGADPVPVSGGATTPNIDAALVLGVAPPASVTAASGDGQALVSWTTPSPVPDREITGWEIRTMPGGARTVVSGSARQATITGLTNGTEYTFVVRALFADGRGGGRSSQAVTPAGAPFAPQSAVAAAGERSANVSWSAPVSDNGSPITSYVVTASPGGAQQVVSGTTTTASFSGLENGITYTFAVRAVNGAGQGPATTSNAVTPVGTPTNDGSAAVPEAQTVDLGEEAAPAVAETGQVTLAGDGYAPFSDVDVELHSTPVLLKTVTTDANGSFRVTVTIPAGVDPGVHTLVATGVTSSGAVRQLSSPITVTSSLAKGGYWLVAGDGGVFSYGDAAFFGSTGGMKLNQPVVGMAATPTGKGYWMVATDGGIFSFGDAAFHGSTGNLKLNKPIVGMTATPDGKGYWMVASDGGIFAFGNAPFLGSTGNIALNKPIVGMASTPTGKGYWLVASDGGIFSFGDAAFRGSTGHIALNSPIVAMAATPTGNGYWMLAADGGVFSFGDAPFFGSQAGRGLAPYVSMRATPSGKGYRLVDAHGRVNVFGDATFEGSAAFTKLAVPMLGMAP